MQQYQIENAIETLIKHLKGATQTDHQIFFKYMEHVCNKNSQYYILGDLQLVANMLKKYDLKEFVDVISLFDYKAAQILDVHMRDSQ
ncbi:hypothetical protein CN330_12125 [Priestia megaterium]|uniref:hypothetical protein n=1 Tax=Priestia megaterium TaxID=1404 RepID=UPI000BFAA24B|nr:hypothetical protein [Priestia megaterium]PEZ12870.1 hypothetical protein CN330_12125 [Priestia megaterium]